MSKPCKTELQATKEAVQALALMKTPGWRIKVWENMGWHWQLYKGGLSVMPSSLGYWTLMSDRGCPNSGASFWTPEPGKRFKDPNKAVDHQLEIAQKFVIKCQHAIDEVRS